MIAFGDSESDLKTSLRVPLLLGAVGVIWLFGGALFWSAKTNIAGAVIAQGSVEVVGKPKSIQHLDGGVVEQIYVTDGQFVEKGQVLVSLDATLLQANLDIYRARLAEALATRGRLVAEQENRSKITYDMDDDLIAGVDKDFFQLGQTQVFDARQELEAGRRDQLAEKIRQYENQTAGVEALIIAKDQQRVLIVQEIKSQKMLADKGLTKASQLLSLQRQEADILGQIAEHRSELARIQNSIRDTELEELQGKRQIKEEVVTALRDVVNQIGELRQQIISTEKQLERVEIRAPNAGRIHEMQITTIGGVVPPGGVILQIVPRDDGLSFRTRVDPISIDQVYPGQEAKLRFSAFNQRTTPELRGRVIDISPTSVRDETTGMSFFWVNLATTDAELSRLGTDKLVPGMPVEAYIKTEDRSVLSYLTKPLNDQLSQAFREE